ncbi:MAG: ABC transporter ATP-binding protein [Deltaproteobacteria bacterium]|nr:ABC transporter ATP-binding protein [Deltaproteobacteria bacterium]
MLELENVTSQYEEKVYVLRDISMRAEEGVVTCVLGPNGAGKTTLVKTIVNLVRPREGRIIFSGIPIQRLRTHQIVKLGISVVPEGRQLFPKLTVAETLRLGAYLENSKEVIRSRMEKVFELFPILAERTRQVAGTLSGGELGILSIARSLMSNPKMMILDEPSLGLAPLITSRVFEAINAINKRGVSVLLIEQNARKALGISSYGYILQKGEIVLQGDSRVLRESEMIRRAYLSRGR